MSKKSIQWLNANLALRRLPSHITKQEDSLLLPHPLFATQVIAAPAWLRFLSSSSLLCLAPLFKFCSGASAGEKWIMQGGRLRQEGESKGTGDDAKEKGLQVEKEVKLDAMGNVIAEKEADMAPKKRKKEIKAIEKQLKDNKKKS